MHGGGALALVVIICKDAKEVERLCTIDTFLAYLPSFQTLNPCDIVFAIMSLAKDAQKPPPSNYNQSGIQVCNMVIQGTIERSGSLNIICHPWTPILPNAPTWLPQISNLPFATDSRGIYNQAADSLVGLPDHRVYLSSGSIKIVDALITPFHKRYVLVIKGFKLETIGSLEESVEREELFLHHGLRLGVMKSKALLWPTTAKKDTSEPW